MKRFNILISLALLTASIIILILNLFSSQEIKIILETGQEVTTQNPNYFTMSTVILLIICSSIIGACITFIYYNAETSQIFQKKESQSHNNINIIMPLLKDDEKKAVRIIRDHNGEILQNELVLKLGLSKVKTTRILSSLEQKQVIIKQRHGLTNHIKLKQSS